MSRMYRICAAFLVGFGLLVIMAGCGTTGGTSQPLDLNPYTMTIGFDPAAPAPSERTVLKAEIKGKDAIPKRAEVSFDIVKKGSVGGRAEVRAGRTGEGLYEAAYTFGDSGTYSITLHIITRRVHQIENVEVEVGAAASGS